MSSGIPTSESFALYHKTLHGIQGSSSSRNESSRRSRHATLYSLQSKISDEENAFLGEEDSSLLSGSQDLPLKTFQDFQEKFEAIAFLQSMQNQELKGKSQEGYSSSYAEFGEDYSQEAQALFDKMFEEWYMNEKDDLEPSNDIYNFLIDIYSNSNSAKNPMQIPEQILQKMENGGGDNVPTPNTNTYIVIMKGWAIAKDMAKVESTFERLQQRYEQTSDPQVYPTTDAYNTLLSAWLKSEIKYAPNKAENVLFKIMERGRINNVQSSSAQSSTTQEEPSEDEKDSESSIDISSSSIGPNSKSFYLVMSCYVRDKFSSQSTKAAKINELLQLMKEWKIQNVDADVDPKHKNISNIRIKAAKTAIDAESILFNMIDEYQREGNGNHRPDAASFINTMNSWRDSRSKEAPQRCLELLDLLTEIYQIESDSDKDATDLKPDKRVYNAVQNVWCRSRERNKAQEVKKLLTKLMSLYEEHEDDDYLPSVRQWNNVLNACVYTKGDKVVRKEVMKIMVETFNELRNASSVDANHVSYGLFLKGCSNLLPSGAKQQTIIENVFRKCCREGLVSEFVFNTFVESSSPELCERLFGGDIHNDDDGIRIPEEWARNT